MRLLANAKIEKVFHVYEKAGRGDPAKRQSQVCGALALFDMG